LECLALVLVTALVRITVRPLFYLAHCAYRFRRIWVAQELINALDPVIHCGDSQIDWRNLWLAARVSQNNERLIGTGLTFFTHHIGVRSLEGASSYYTMADMRLRAWGYMSPAYMVISFALGEDEGAPARLLSQRGLRPHENIPIRRDLSAILNYERLMRPNALRDRADGNILYNAKKPELVEMLNRTNQHLATNPVDRIYAVLGLAHDIDLNKPDFRIEYSAEQSPAIVCQRFAAGLMKQGQGAAVLGMAGTTRQACQTVSHGPSWVPDWTTPISPNKHVMSMNLFMNGQDYADRDIGTSYYAAGPSTMHVCFEDADNTLVVRGALFDTLVHITKGQLFAPPTWYLNILLKFAQPGADAQRVEESLWRTLIANQTSKGGPSELAAQYQAYKARTVRGLGYAGIFAGLILALFLPFIILGLRRIGWIYLMVVYAPIWLMGWDDLPLHTIAAIIQLCNYSVPVIFIGCCIIAWRAKELGYAYLVKIDVGWQYLAGMVMSYNPTGPRYHKGPPECADFMESFLRYAGRYNLGITAAGYVGLFPLAAKLGDKIMVLEGGFTPFLLRLTEDGEAFTLVGECYVDGIMKGEAWDEASKQLQEFRIV
jgi:hypothetical protein